MKIVKATFNGKEYLLPANNSNWISNSEMPLPEGITPEFLKNLPRIGRDSKGMPIVQDDNGKHLTLGSAAFRHEDEKIIVGGGASTTTYVPRTKLWEDLDDATRTAWDEVKKACKKDPKVLELFETIRPKTREEQAAIDAEAKKAAKIAALKAQLAALLGE